MPGATIGRTRTCLTESRPQVFEISTTVATQAAAEAMAAALLEQRLAACVQINGPILSLYHWRGNIERSQEYGLKIKTSQDRLEQAVAYLHEHHPYDLPEILTRTSMASAEYAHWVQENTQPKPCGDTDHHEQELHG
jgi:periplasmic divalent cation tolerance protein